MLIIIPKTTIKKKYINTHIHKNTHANTESKKNIKMVQYVKNMHLTLKNSDREIKYQKYKAYRNKKQNDRSQSYLIINYIKYKQKITSTKGIDRKSG